jgi:hypothetical protein
MSAGKINNGRPQSASLHVHLTNSGAHPEPSSPHGNSGPHGGQRLHATLSWQHLVGITFFAVCGGDYGLEDSVGAAGPALTLLGLLILPWIWSLPIALMTAELGSMIPEAGGYVVWINRAFGPFAAHMNALWNLVSNTFDNALYPVMFVDYLHYFPAMRLEGAWLPAHSIVPLTSGPLWSSGWLRWFVSLAMLTVVTVLNLLGVDVVAGASNLFALLVIAPFAALFVAGLPEVEPSSWLEGLSAQPVRWGTFLSVMLWNTSGYDAVGSLAAEVHDPGRDFPLAMVRAAPRSHPHRSPPAARVLPAAHLRRAAESLSPGRDTSHVALGSDDRACEPGVYPAAWRRTLARQGQQRGPVERVDRRPLCTHRCGPRASPPAPHARSPGPARSSTRRPADSR